VDNVKAKGRAWAQLSGRELEQVQVPYVSREEVAQVVTRGKPMRKLPEIPEVADIATVEVVEDDPSLPDAKRVKLLKEQGLSLNEIQRRVFGYVGGAAYDAVKKALE
jgi:hypothetical protein